MIFNLITAFVVACAAVTASEMLTRIWEYFCAAGTMRRGTTCPDDTALGRRRGANPNTERFGMPQGSRNAK
jgi:hypothetical protein